MSIPRILALALAIAALPMAPAQADDGRAPVKITIDGGEIKAGKTAKVRVTVESVTEQPVNFVLELSTRDPRLTIAGTHKFKKQGKKSGQLKAKGKTTVVFSVTPSSELQDEIAELQASVRLTNTQTKEPIERGLVIRHAPIEFSGGSGKIVSYVELSRRMDGTQRTSEHGAFNRKFYEKRAATGPRKFTEEELKQNPELREFKGTPFNPYKTAKNFKPEESDDDGDENPRRRDEVDPKND